MNPELLSNIGYASFLALVFAAGYLKVIPPDYVLIFSSGIVGNWLGLKVIPPSLQKSVSIIRPASLNLPASTLLPDRSAPAPETGSTVNLSSNMLPLAQDDVANAIKNEGV